MTNLLDRLRAETGEACGLCHEAVIEIERLGRLVAGVRKAFNRECDDADAILRALGLAPENCRTDGGSLMLQDVLETLKHCDAALRYEARLHKDRADDCGRLARMVLDCCPTAKCTNPARDCYGSGCLSDGPQSAVAAAFGGLVQTPQGCGMSTDNTEPGRLAEELCPVVECGWRYVPSKVWGDQVLTQDPKTAQLAREYGRDLVRLFALTSEDVEAVNADRKHRAWQALRRLDLCECDHHEYCRHCHPPEFRPGGMWGGPNVGVNRRA